MFLGYMPTQKAHLLLPKQSTKKFMLPSFPVKPLTIFRTILRHHAASAPKKRTGLDTTLATVKTDTFFNRIEANFSFMLSSLDSESDHLPSNSSKSSIAKGRSTSVTEKQGGMAACTAYDGECDRGQVHLREQDEW